MPRIRHIALACKDTAAVAKFYKKAFGLVEISRRADVRDPNAFYIALSDGYISLSLVPDIVGYPEGINHFGFQVEDRDKVVDTAIRLGAKPGDDLPHGPNTEIAIVDPTGTRVDIRVSEWKLATREQIAEAAETLDRT